MFESRKDKKIVNKTLTERYNSMFESYVVSENLKETACLIMFRFIIDGFSDGMYTCNTIAHENRFGDGHGSFFYGRGRDGGRKDGGRTGMGLIFYVLGKSASGKDTVFKRILKAVPEMKKVIPYTTRPIRKGEQDGVEYFFSTEEELKRLKEENKVIEMRTYQTVLGPWSYATVQDGQIDLLHHNYLMIGTLESYQNTRAYFGKEKVIPFYLEVGDRERLERAMERERQQKEPRYTEVYRRFKADKTDFCKEKLRLAEIGKWYENTDLEKCLKEILDEIHHYVSI